jgi:aminopeptidase N
MSLTKSALLLTAILAGPALSQARLQGADPYTFANVDQFRVVHIALDLTVDFTNKVLRGGVGLEIQRLDPHATQLVLDTRGLIVTQVSQLTGDIVGATEKPTAFWVSRPFSVGKPDPVLGSPLIIDLPPSTVVKETIKVEYETTPGAPALQWLTAAQTAGRRQPFLYTQSEPINARSWIPLQDTPQVRATYRAMIHTPDGVIALMSAPNDPKAKRNGNFAFDMPQPVPSYLIALAVGDLTFKATGTRSGVYAERPVVAAAAREFGGTEAMIQAAEKIMGPYLWGRYDILVMPPSFPLGGMENPSMSFITPSVLAGDQSLVALIAHELAHSWTGNLVGNARWRDLWLNEGFAVYLEGRIMKSIYGEARGEMADTMDLEALRKAFDRLGPDEQLLVPDRAGRDPGDVFSDIPYEKGCLFLNYLDAKFGRAPFDAFLRSYVDRFAFQSITTERFVDYLRDTLMDRRPDIVSHAELEAWLREPGLPADAVLPHTAAFHEVDDARQEWLAGNPIAKRTQPWVLEEWLYFLNGMPALSPAQLAALDQAYGFNRSHNAELERSWFLLAIGADYRPAYPALEAYLEHNGRRKLVKPLYQELMKTTAGAEFAKRVYSQARPGYHPVMAEAMDAIVKR